MSSVIPPRIPQSSLPDGRYIVEVHQGNIYRHYLAPNSQGLGDPPSLRRIAIGAMVAILTVTSPLWGPFWLAGMLVERWQKKRLR